MKRSTKDMLLVVGAIGAATSVCALVLSLLFAFKIAQWKLLALCFLFTFVFYENLRPQVKQRMRLVWKSYYRDYWQRTKRLFKSTLGKQYQRATCQDAN